MVASLCLAEVSLVPVRYRPYMGSQEVINNAFYIGWFSWSHAGDTNTLNHSSLLYTSKESYISCITQLWPRLFQAGP